MPGPRPDGTIPEPEEKILREIGQWLAVNGEAIYGTRPWKEFGEGPTEVVAGSFNDTKRLPFAEAAAGAIGVETMLSAGLRLVTGGHVSLPRLIRAMTLRPAEILRLPRRSTFPAGRSAGHTRPGLPWLS